MERGQGLVEYAIVIGIAIGIPVIIAVVLSALNILQFPVGLVVSCVSLYVGVPMALYLSGLRQSAK